MSDLDFTVLGVKPANYGITPLLEFELRVDNQSPEQPIQAVALHVQIQIECPRRSYSADEKASLLELFGKPERWGQTLRNRLWCHVDTTVPAFTGATAVRLLVPCTFDLRVASAKYFHALEEGEVALLFLYSGSVFYQADDGRLQVSRISWNKEGRFRMPVAAWQETIDHHYPNSGWLALDRQVFKRLDAFRRGLPEPTWEQAIENLLDAKPATHALKEVMS